MADAERFGVSSVDMPAHARVLAELGFFVFPVHGINSDGTCTCGTPACSSPGKHPLRTGWQGLATRDPEEAERLFRAHPGTNLAIRTGPEQRVMVLDVDLDGLGLLRDWEDDLPKTVRVRTGSGGVHLYFRPPEDIVISNSASRLAPGIDIRGEGGFVVGPPSTHMEGTYEFETGCSPSETEIAECPAWLCEAAQKKKTSSLTRPRQARDFGDDEIIPRGERNSTLTSIGGSLRRTGLGVTEIEAALVEVNRRRCHPPLTESEVRGIAQSLGRYSPSADGALRRALRASGQGTIGLDALHGFGSDILGLLPSCIAQLLYHVEADHERDALLLSTLGTLSACLPNVEGQYGGKTYSPNVYVAMLGQAGSGKSVMRHARAIADGVHAFLAERARTHPQDPHLPQGPCALYIAGNSSGAAFESALEACQGTGLIMEEEIDTIGNVLDQDWGDFSDKLRKAFEHEPITSAREGRRHLFIERPQMSVVLTGTPDQIVQLIRSTENGLFSRYCYLYLGGVSLWRSPRPTERAARLREAVEALKGSVVELYRALARRSTSLQVVLTDSQWGRVDEAFQGLHDRMAKDPKRRHLLSIVRRQGVVAFRLCMILAVARAWTTASVDLETSESISPTNDDLEAALLISSTCLTHGLALAHSLPERSPQLQVTSEDLFLARLPDAFATREAVDIGERMTLSRRTVEQRLGRYVEDGHLSRPKKGHYRKAA